MKDSEKIIKQLEIQEKKIKNRTILISTLVPLFSVLITLLISYMTILKEYDIDKMNYTQEQISQIISDPDIINIKKKIKFLLDADLIGDKKNKLDIEKAMDINLVSENESMKHLMLGQNYFHIAYKSKDLDSIKKYYGLAIDEFIQAKYLNPKNVEARSLLGVSYSNLGFKTNFDSYLRLSLNEYNIVLQLDSTQYWIHVEKGLLFSGLNINDSICKEVGIALRYKDNFSESRKEDLDRLNNAYCSK